MFYGFDYEEGEDRGAGGNDDDETTDEVLVLGDDGREAILIDVEDEETNGIEVECGKFTAGGTKKWLYSVNFMHETDKSVDAKNARRARKEKLDAKRNEQPQNKEFRKDSTNKTRKVGVALKHNESIQNGSVSIPEHSSRGLCQCKYCSAVLFKEEEGKSWCCHRCLLFLTVKNGGIVRNRG